MSISSISSKTCCSNRCTSLPYALTTLAATVALIASLVIGAPLFLTIICACATLASLIAWYTAPDQNFMAMGRDSKEKANQVFKSTYLTQESLETVDSLLTKARQERDRATKELQHITQLSRSSDQSRAEMRGVVNSLETTADQLTLAQQTEQASIAALQNQNLTMRQTTATIDRHTNKMEQENKKLKKTLAEQTNHLTLLTETLSQFRQHNEVQQQFTKTAEQYIAAAPTTPQTTFSPHRSPLPNPTPIFAQ